MPIYDYQCDVCGIFEYWGNINDDVIKCNSCGRLSKRIISPSRFILKGDGWSADNYNPKPKEKDDIKPKVKPGFLNVDEIRNSNICGCYYCLRIFKPEEITEWVDENLCGTHVTALCPYCHIDSVIGFEGYLKRLREYWF